MDRFLFVANSSPLHAPAEASACLRGPYDPFEGLGRAVIHPRDGGYKSFEFWSVGEGRFHVGSPGLLGDFDSPRKDNLLHFRRPPRADALMISDPLGVPLWYRRARASELTPLLGGSLASQSGPCGREFYRQVERPPDEFQRVELDHEGDRPPGPPDACLNPLVLALRAGGDELSGDGRRATIAGFAAEDALLLVEPILGPSADGRAMFWHDCDARVAARAGPMSPMEALFFGPLPHRPGEGWRAFQALDALGGTFVMDCRGGGPSRIGWVAPRRARRGNAAWLARRWLGAWGGEAMDSAVGERPIEPEPRLRASGPPALRREFLVDGALAEGLGQSSAALLGLLPTASDRASGPLALVACLLSGSSLVGTEADRCHVGSYEILERTAGGCRVGFDPIRFLDRFARRCVLPESGIRVGFPTGVEFIGRPDEVAEAAALHDRTLAPWFVDPSRSLRRGGWRFLDRFLEGLGRPHADEASRIGHRFGWWSEWYDRHFQAGRGSGLSLEMAGSGFVIGGSRVGRARLGRSAEAYRQGLPIWL